VTVALRKTRPSSYLDPDTGVLVNLVGARTQAALQNAENDLVIVRQIELAERPIPGRFDLPHLCAIHRHLFGDVYPFAGQLRNVDLSKHTDPSTRFARARLLSTLAAKVFAELAAEGRLQGLPRQAFVDRLTYYFVSLNYLHPFREGNGRTLRVFLSDLAAASGYPLNWTRICREDNLMASRNPDTMARQLIDRVIGEAAIPVPIAMPVGDLRLDWYDRRILEYVLRWAPYSGPPADEAFVQFGLNPDELGRRFCAVVDAFARELESLERSDRELLDRAARFRYGGHC